MRTFNSIAIDGRDSTALQTLRVGSEWWRGIGDRSVVAPPGVRERQRERRLLV
jgi:hypothetical protein